MNANTILQNAIQSNKGYLSVQDTMHAIGVECRQTIYRMIDDGRLECSRNGNQGWLRISVDSILSHLALSKEDFIERTDDTGVYVYCRVSSESQNQAGSLKRQVQRMTEEVEKAEGAKPIIVKECASAMKDRDGLAKILDAVMDGRCTKLYVRTYCRLARIPGQLSTIEHICKRFNVPIIAVDDVEDDPDENSAMVRELLNIITIFSNRHAAKAAKKVCEKVLSAECIQRIIELAEMGLNRTQVHKQIVKEGWKTSHGDSPSHHKVRAILDSNGVQKIAKSLVGTGVHCELEEWFKSRVKRVPRFNKKNMAHRVRSGDLYKLYVEDMKKAKKTVFDNRISFGQKMARLLPKEAIYTSSGIRWYLGYTLKTA